MLQVQVEKGVNYISYKNVDVWNCTKLASDGGSVLVHHAFMATTRVVNTTHAVPITHHCTPHWGGKGTVLTPVAQS